MAEKKQKQAPAQTPEPVQDAELEQEPVQVEDLDVQDVELEQESVQATDQAIPGGLYIVNNQVVDANNQPIPGYSVVDGQVVVQGK